MCLRVRVKLSQPERTGRTLAYRQEVRYLSAMISYSDLMCEIILTTQDDLYDFSTQTLGQLPGVQGIDVGLELQTIKRAYLRMTTPEGLQVSSGTASTEAESTAKRGSDILSQERQKSQALERS